MSKGEQNIHLFFVVVTVADKNSFGVVGHSSVSGIIKVGRIVLQFYRERLGKLSAGIYAAKEQFDLRYAHRLSAKIAFQNRLGAVYPRHLNRRAVMQNDDDVFVDLGDFFNQNVLVGRKLHVASVVALRLVAVGKAGEYYDCLGLFSGGDGGL